MEREAHKKPLFMEIAETLQNEIEALSENETLSIASLAKRYNVSCVTMSKAVHLFRAKGMLRIFPGKGIVMKKEGRGTSKPDSNRNSSSSKLYRKIREAIIEGTRRTGHDLAKIRSLALSEHVSESTVCEALRMLEKENLIHKIGRRWIVGPRKSESASHGIFLSPISAKPVVVMLWSDFWDWNSSCHYPHNMNFYFYQMFKREVEMRGIGIQIGFTDSTETDSTFPKGIEQIRNLIVSLGDRYAGTVLRQSSDPIACEMWVGELARFRKPVVCFHKHCDYRKVNAVEQYVFCDWNEEKAMALALDTLVSQGHRIIGSLRPALESKEETARLQWIAGRIAMLEELARGYDPPIKIIVQDQKEDFWHTPQWRGNERGFPPFLQDLIKRHFEPSGNENDTAARVLSYRNALRKCSPALWNLVTYPGLTAIVAPNDIRARLYSVWLKEAGIAVPGDLSLIGFDNDMESHYHRISSVDFCFGDLGYQAAHIFTGDIPVRIGRDRIMKSEPKIIDRGSIGPPRKAERLLAV